MIILKNRLYFEAIFYIFFDELDKSYEKKKGSKMTLNILSRTDRLMWTFAEMEKNVEEVDVR